MKNISVCLVGAALLLASTAEVSAQSFRQFKPKVRKQWFALSTDWSNMMPLHLKESPFEQLAGRELGTSQRKDWDYESRGDGGLTQVDVLEYQRRARGFGLAVYPFGSATGPALMLKGSVQTLPTFRARFDGPSNVDSYELVNAKAYDAGVGIIVADRSPGWGLGSHAFVIGGIGRLDSGHGRGSRVFAEGGGGLSVGPVGVEISMKFAYNKLKAPIDHGFYSVPVTLRATIGF
ncbi:MAG: hypothetical protein WD690_03870 [Vicinamibacterales bacterium]